MLKWSLPDNSHVCLVSESGDNESPDRDHVSRDMAVSVSTDHRVSTKKYNFSSGPRQEVLTFFWDTVW